MPENINSVNSTFGLRDSQPLPNTLFFIKKYETNIPLEYPTTAAFGTESIVPYRIKT